MRNESTRTPVVAVVVGLALVLVLAGCGGTETPQRAEATETPRPAVATDAVPAPTPADEPARVATPRGTDEVYDEILRALDSAYTELGNPPPDFAHLSDVQDRASKQLAGAAFDWPSGTSYSLSVLDDRVAVYINCDGQEKRGDWVPGGEAEQPS